METKKIAVWVILIINDEQQEIKQKFLSHIKTNIKTKENIQMHY